MPAIEISCPSCGKESIVETKLREPSKGGVAEMLMSIMGNIGVKSYAFTGEGRCGKCGKSIDVSITIGSGVREA